LPRDLSGLSEEEKRAWRRELSRKRKLVYNARHRERLRERSRVYRVEHKEKARECVTRWHSMNRELSRSINGWCKRIRVYGITEIEFNNRVRIQDGLCAICRRPETAKYKGKVVRLSIDHDHKTGKVRDLLCKKCNIVIGMADESEEILLEMISYLRRHKVAA
jgi:hypothetical protein